MNHSSAAGHLAALLTILIWGTTFISTKVLLRTFQPVEILLIRFLLGFLALVVVCPHGLKRIDGRQEGAFALAGLCGVCLYYLLENIALTYTLAANVAVIVSASPFFTALLTRCVEGRGAALGANFYLGFVVAMGGICLLSFGGSALQLNPLGDLLALLAALVWAAYSVLSRRIGSYGYGTVEATRRIFGWGILFILPAAFFSGGTWELSKLANPVVLGNLLFLGLGASALCFVTWNFAVRVVGTVKTSIYIYLVPVITVVTSVLVLREQITPFVAGGIVLTLVGLAVSEVKWRRKSRGN